MTYKHLILAVGLMCGYVSAAVAETYVFTAPPRESSERGDKEYGPIATYLSNATGNRFEYRHYNYWPIYVRDMQAGKLDLIFDGPHFISWRIEKLNHTPLARLPGKLEFVVVALEGDKGVSSLNDLAGRLVCGHVPPNLATLTLLREFSNPLRQPQIHEVHGFKSAYQGLIGGTCQGAVLPNVKYARMVGSETLLTKTKVLFESKSLPNQGFSAGARIPEKLQEAIRAALISPAGINATAGLRARFAGADRLVATNSSEYGGFSHLLMNYWGFEANKSRLSQADRSTPARDIAVIHSQQRTQ